MKMKSRNLNLESLTDHTADALLTSIINTLATGATFGERKVLQDHGFVQDENLDSHHVNEACEAVAVKFSTGASQPYFLVAFGEEFHVVPGFYDYGQKHDEEKYDVYLKRLGAALEKLGYAKPIGQE